MLRSMSAVCNAAWRTGPNAISPDRSLGPASKPSGRLETGGDASWRQIQPGPTGFAKGHRQQRAIVRATYPTLHDVHRCERLKYLADCRKYPLAAHDQHGIILADMAPGQPCASTSFKSNNGV